MALTEQQKVDVRRHLGFGPIGNNPNGGSFISYRFFVTQGQLEYRLLNLSPEEEKMLVGSGNPAAPTHPYFKNPEDDTIIQGYVNICNFLESQIALTSDNLDIEQAGDYHARQDEHSARARLYVWRAKRMAQALFVAMGTPLSGGPRGSLVA